jgi:hypothetical protein
MREELPQDGGHLGLLQTREWQFPPFLCSPPSSLCSGDSELEERQERHQGSRAHQDGDGFGQGPTGLEAILGVLQHVLPLQAQCSEGPARGLLALGVEDEAARDLVLYR